MFISLSTFSREQNIQIIAYIAIFSGLDKDNSTLHSESEIILLHLILRRSRYLSVHFATNIIMTCREKQNLNL